MLMAVEKQVGLSHYKETPGVKATGKKPATLPHRAVAETGTFLTRCPPALITNMRLSFGDGQEKAARNRRKGEKVSLKTAEGFDFLTAYHTIFRA